MSTAVDLSQCPECVRSYWIADAIGFCACPCGSEYRKDKLDCEFCPIVYRASAGSRFLLTCECGRRFRDPETCGKKLTIEADELPPLPKPKHETQFERDLRVIVFELLRLNRALERSQSWGGGEVSNLYGVIQAGLFGWVGLGHKSTVHMSPMYNATLNRFKKQPPPAQYEAVWKKYNLLDGKGLQAADLLVDDYLGLQPRTLIVEDHKFELTYEQWVGYWTEDQQTRTKRQQRFLATTDHRPVLLGMQLVGHDAITELVQQWIELGDDPLEMP